MFRARPIDSSHFLCMRRAADRCLRSKKRAATRCSAHTITRYKGERDDGNAVSAAR